MDRCNLWPWHAVIKILIRSIWLLLFHLAIFLGIVSRKNSYSQFCWNIRVLCVYISLLLWPTLKENFAFQEVPDDPQRTLVLFDILTRHIFAYPYDGKVSIMALCKKHLWLWNDRYVCQGGNLQEFKNSFLSFHASQFTSVCSAWVFLAQ